MAGPAAGRVPAIHVFTDLATLQKTWMAAAGYPARVRAGTPTSPAKTLSL